MNENELDFEEWYKSLEEFSKGMNNDSQKKSKDDEGGNFYGAGGFGYIRSSKSKKSLVYQESAEYNSSCNRWFEYLKGGFSCEADSDLEDDWYALYRADFDRKHPRITYKEAYYRFTYGNTRDEIADVMFLLIEQNRGKSRTFSFDMENITKQEFQKYFEAIEHWHCTGELNVGEFKGTPPFTTWKQN
jgi:hypothetical protein